jgi:hypothetical protein
MPRQGLNPRPLGPAAMHVKNSFKIFKSFTKAEIPQIQHFSIQRSTVFRNAISLAFRVVTNVVNNAIANGFFLMALQPTLSSFLLFIEVS